MSVHHLRVIVCIGLAGMLGLMQGCAIKKMIPSTAVITGEMKHYDESTFLFSYDIFSPLEKTQKERIQIGEDGRFRISIDMDKPVIGTLDFGRVLVDGLGIQRLIGVYLEPGDSVHVTADLAVDKDVNRISNTLQYSGSGLANQHYIKSEDELFNTYEQRVQNNHRFIAEKGPVDYARAVDSIRDLKLAYLDNYADTAALSSTLETYYRDTYTNLPVIRKINYPSSNRNFNNGVAQTLPPDYYHFIDDVQLAEDLSEKALPYLRFLHFFLTNKHRLAQQNGDKRDFIEFLDTELKGRAKYVYMAYSLGSDFNPTIYAQFGDESPYPDISRTVKQRYSHLESMLPGQPAPAVQLTSPDGKTTGSDDAFADKFVYIDFWATWCKPCIREFPYLATLKEEYQDQDIIFVSISFDKAKEDWLSYIEREKLTGHQFWVDSENKKIYDDSFNITMIPRFVLIDKDGKIVDANAPRPSSGEEIRKLLDETMAISQ